MFLFLCSTVKKNHKENASYGALDLHRLKSGDAVIIAPPLAVCLSTIYNELNTACNRRMIVKQTKERGYIMYFNFQYKVIIRKDKQSKITGYKFAESEKIAAVICERLNSLGLYAIYCKY